MGMMDMKPNNNHSELKGNTNIKFKKHICVAYYRSHVCRVPFYL